MFENTLSLANAAAASQTFIRQGASQNASAYIENDSTSSVTRTIEIRHQNGGKSAQPGRFIRRHNVKFAQAKVNSTTGKMHNATVNLTITHDPFDGTTDHTALLDLCSFAKEFLDLEGDGLVDQLLRDEV